MLSLVGLRQYSGLFNISEDLSGSGWKLAWLQRKGSSILVDLERKEKCFLILNLSSGRQLMYTIGWWINTFLFRKVFIESNATGSRISQNVALVLLNKHLDSVTDFLIYICLYFSSTFLALSLALKCICILPSTLHFPSLLQPYFI